MSDIDRKRMIPLHIADQAVAACDAEIAKLREENQRLRTAGDAMAEALNLNDDVFDNQDKREAQANWNAAKEGKPHA
jgi:hypothetical protein